MLVAHIPSSPPTSLQQPQNLTTSNRNHYEL
ncbi:hypothetical protein Patl1_31970 [Pistacia atlantica]|uniref:Uncharacterized protein n=1 Tax=Pistacia atlantica TaxID=434234 RepID=A0ACC1AMY0_9ROSI|nr:hypothetical protein Patl1_31970 [Pistacia atlantica]